MKLLFDIFPVLIFFICYKIFGIYVATAMAMVASVIQVIVHRIQHKSFETMHLLSLGLILILGGATLFFHNPEFIKWKPTGIYWLSGLIFVGSSFIGKTTVIQKMIGKNIDLPANAWNRLNLAWSVFFAIMGALNLYVAYYFDTNTWVNFKLFGCSGVTLIFVFLQALYITKHVMNNKRDDDRTFFIDP